MSTVLIDSERNIIPRWRTFETTVALGELDQPFPIVPNKPAFDLDRSFELESKIIAWETNPGVGVAADLINAAVAHNIASRRADQSCGSTTGSLLWEA